MSQIVQTMRNGKQLPADAYDRADQKKLATGTLEAFNSQIENTTGTLLLRATFKNDDTSFFRTSSSTSTCWSTSRGRHVRLLIAIGSLTDSFSTPS